MTFNSNYFIKFISLLLIEASIALFIKGGFIRHTLGDFLVVILLYCLLKSFIKISPLLAAWIVLIMSTLIELGQYFDLLSRLNLEQNSIAKLVLGSTFSFGDLVAYLLGIITVIIIEKNRKPSI